MRSVHHPKTGHECCIKSAALVPGVDEGTDLGVEVLDGGEDSSADGHTVDCDTVCPIFRTVDTVEVGRMLDVQMRSPRE